MEITINKNCPICGKEWFVVCDNEDYKKFLSGKYLVQQRFPCMKPSDRELFISGICDYCFDELFKD